MNPFLVPIASLRRAPGARRAEHRRGVVPPADPDQAAVGLVLSGTVVPEGAEVEADVVLEVVSGGVFVSGLVTAPWRGDCRRCLGSVDGRLVAEVAELYAPRQAGAGHGGPDDETYPLALDFLDLTPCVRDAVLLGLPLAPLCRPGCLGLCPTCGADRNDGACSCPEAGGDSRWAGLDALGGTASPGPGGRRRSGRLD
ncbi:MAG: YceD family protein [Acidimicrobiales bacterium]